MFSCLEKRDRWILLRRPVGQNEVSSVPSYPRNVLVFLSTCHHGVVVAIPTRVLTMEILGVTAVRSWWYPHLQMFRGVWESTCGTPSGILISSFPDVGIAESPPCRTPSGILVLGHSGISRSQLGVLLVASSFQGGGGILGVNLECS